MQTESTTKSAHRVVRNSTFMLVAQGLYHCCQLIVVLVLARTLGKAGLGEYCALFALVMSIQLIAEWALSTVLTHRIVQAKRPWEEIMAEAAGQFALVSVISAAVFVLWGGVAAWLNDDPGILVRYSLAGLACAVTQVQRFCAGVFRAWEQFRYENQAKLLEGLVFAGVVIGLAVCGWMSLVAVLVMLAVSRAVAALTMTVTLLRRTRGWRWRFGWGVTMDWLREASALGFGDIVRRLTWQLDTVLLSFMQPAEVVGIYSVAYRPLSPLNQLLPQTVSMACFPMFTRMASGDREALGRAFSTSTRLLWVLALPIAVTICVCAEPLIVLLAGKDFLEAAVPMRILIWIATLSFLSVQFRFIFTAMGRQKVFAALVVVVFLIEAAVEVALIPRWGYFGACAGSLAGELFFTAVGLTMCWWLGLGRIEWKAAIGATVAAALMAAALWPARGLPLPLLAMAAALAGLLYLGLCLLFGALSMAEMRHFVDAVRHRGDARRGRPQPVAAGANGQPAAAPQTIPEVGAAVRLDAPACSGSIS
jgi:O-antigen/teichoic acid export membrane protein